MTAAHPALLRVPAGARPLAWLALALLVIASLVLPSGVRAASGAEAAMAAARQAMAAGRPEEAYQRLAPHIDEAAGDPRFDYLLGIAALDSGRSLEAVFALERVVALEPDNALARAELARAYLAIRAFEESRREFETVQAMETVPEEARAAIDRYLAALSRPAEAGLEWRAFVLAGFGYDSNVNSATSDDQVSIGGVTFLINPGSRSAQDVFAEIAAGGSVAWPLGRNTSLVASASARHRGLESEGDFDFTTLNGALGVNHRRGRSIFLAGLQAQRFIVDGDTNRDSVGALVQATRELGGGARAAVFGQLARLTYPGQSVRNANRHVVGVNYSRPLPGYRQATVFVGGFGGREQQNADAQDHLGHVVRGGRAGVEWPLRAGLRLFGTALYELRDYRGTDPLFGVKREDERLTAQLGAAWEPFPEWVVVPSVLYVRNVSNISVHDFSRFVGSMVVRRSFR